MTRTNISRTFAVTPRMEEAWQAVDACFGRFCLTAGVEALQAMMAADVEDLCGRRHARSPDRRGHRWGRTRGKIGYQGGKVDIVRPRVRDADGEEIPLPSWTAAATEDWLGKTAMNLMLIGVSTRRFGRAVRLPEADVPAGPGSGVSKSATSRRFVALSAERLAAWLVADPSGLDPLAVQIAGHYLKQAIESGQDGGRELHALTVEQMLAHLDAVLEEARSGVPA